MKGRHAHNRKGAVLTSDTLGEAQPYQKCNYPGPCPTPATLFNRPEYTSELRSHYHIPNHRCAQGRSHELHCVFRSANDRRHDCLLGSRVRHCCCRRRPRAPGGQRRSTSALRRPPPLIEFVPENATIERGSRGEIIRVVVEKEGKDGEALEEFVELPYEIGPMEPDPVRDLDAVGEEAYGVGQRTDLVGREWVLGREDVFGREDLIVMLPPPAGTTPTWDPTVNGQSELRGEQIVFGVGAGDDDDDGVDVFADRHFDVDEYEDENGGDGFAERHLDMNESSGGGFVTETDGGPVYPQFWDGREQQHSALDIGFDFVHNAQDWLPVLGYSSGIPSFQI